MIPEMKYLEWLNMSSIPAYSSIYLKTEDYETKNKTPTDTKHAWTNYGSFAFSFILLPSPTADKNVLADICDATETRDNVAECLSEQCWHDLIFIKFAYF